MIPEQYNEFKAQELKTRLDFVAERLARHWQSLPDDYAPAGSLLDAITALFDITNNPELYDVIRSLRRDR